MFSFAPDGGGGRGIRVNNEYLERQKRELEKAKALRRKEAEEAIEKGAQGPRRVDYIPNEDGGHERVVIEE